MLRRNILRPQWSQPCFPHNLPWPMKILISSHAYAPSIGGIETVSKLLAQQFIRLGNEVKVVTQTPADHEVTPEPAVIRQPTVPALCAALRWCDIYWQSNLSLRTLWPVLLVRRPVVITHQGSYCRAPAGIDFHQRLKHAVVQRFPSVAASDWVADCFPMESTIIPPPYDAQVFRLASGKTTRDKDLIFLGRLVSEKGVDILLRALGELQARGVTPDLTIVGRGPEESSLQDLRDRLGLHERVTFVGPKRGEELADLLRRHRILVVPSRYEEPFGVVALEAIACGCVVIGSGGGGLPEAIGPCGLTFPNGDVDALSRTLERLLLDPDEQARLRENAPAHLKRFEPASVAQQYLGLFQKLL